MGPHAAAASETTPAPDVIVPPARRTSHLLRWAYGLGAAAFGVKNTGFSVLLLLFYNQVMGLPAWKVSAGIAVALVADAFVDPVIGRVSDGWRSRLGRRHPLMYAAAIPATVSYYFLWNPPALSPEALLAYLIAVSIVVRTFISLYEVPSASLAAELTADFDERTTLLSYRSLFNSGAGYILILLAYGAFLKADPAHPVGQLNPAGYSLYGLVASLVMLVAIVGSALGTQGYVRSSVNLPKLSVHPVAIFRDIVTTLAHRSFLFVLAASVLTAMAAGLAASLNVYFSTYFWGLSAANISAITSSALLSTLFAFFLAPRLSRAFGKKPTAIATTLLGLVTVSTAMILRLLGVLPPNGSPIIIPVLYAQAISTQMFLIIAATVTTSMIADVVDDSQLRTGRRSEGVFFAASSFVQKVVSGVGVLSAGLTLLLVGFPAHAQPGRVPVATIDHLAEVYLLFFWSLNLLSLFLIGGYRINRQSHEAALRRLAATAEPPPPSAA
jgi:GPH family glycoside/pentoside/hexuronide:cation symporter